MRYDGVDLHVTGETIRAGDIFLRRCQMRRSLLIFDMIWRSLMIHIVIFVRRAVWIFLSIS